MFSAYSDRTGQSSAAGRFTWVPTDRNIEVTTADGSFSIISDLIFSIDEDTASFQEFYGTGRIARTRCARQPF